MRTIKIIAYQLRSTGRWAKAAYAKRYPNRVIRTIIQRKVARA